MASKENVHIFRLLSAMMEVAEGAGDIIRKVHASGELDIRDKGGDDPMTVADTTAQRMINGTLRSLFPGLTVIGEEDETPGSEAAVVKTEKLGKDVNLERLMPGEWKERLRRTEYPLRDLVVWVDPLDATKQFTIGNTECVLTLIGVAFEGKPLAGVMHQPFPEKERAKEGRTIWGLRGLGAFGYDKGQGSVGPLRPGHRRIIVTTSTHHTPEIGKAIDDLRPTKVVRVGGCGYKALQVLEGFADAYLYPSSGTKKWDTCAPEAIMRAAGGKLTDAYGKDLEYGADVVHMNGNGVLATMLNHESFVLTKKNTRNTLVEWVASHEPSDTRHQPLENEAAIIKEVEHTFLRDIRAQCFVLPVQSVGVQGDQRSYAHACGIVLPKLCEATWKNDLLWELGVHIPNHMKMFNRVLVCASHAALPSLVFQEDSYITEDRVATLQEADARVMSIIRERGLYNQMFQCSIVLVPVGLEHGEGIVVRAVESYDAMTASPFQFSWDVVEEMTQALCSIPNVDLVFLDLTPKPAATIEWE